MAAATLEPWTKGPRRSRLQTDSVPGTRSSRGVWPVGGSGRQRGWLALGINVSLSATIRSPPVSLKDSIGLRLGRVHDATAMSDAFRCGETAGPSAIDGSRKNTRGRQNPQKGYQPCRHDQLCSLLQLWCTSHLCFVTHRSHLCPPQGQGPVLPGWPSHSDHSMHCMDTDYRFVFSAEVAASPGCCCGGGGSSSPSPRQLPPLPAACHAARPPPSSGRRSRTSPSAAALEPMYRSAMRSHRPWLSSGRPAE